MNTIGDLESKITFEVSLSELLENLDQFDIESLEEIRTKVDKLLEEKHPHQIKHSVHVDWMTLESKGSIYLSSVIEGHLANIPVFIPESMNDEIKLEEAISNLSE